LFAAETGRLSVALREKQKTERRNRILDAAERLIRETGGTDFSVRVLAAVSGVSAATPFNLFGSKEALLYALLSRSLDQIVTDGLSFKSPDTAFHVIEAAEKAVNAFVSDPEFLRPLYRVLLGVSHPVHRPLFMQRTFAYWKTATLTVKSGALRSNPALQDVVAQALMAHFIGLLELWVHRDLDDDAFRTHAVCDVILNVHAVAAPEQVPKLMARLKITFH
jgi:AcrR family transcriptional regulator